MMVSSTFRPFAPGKRADGSLWKKGWVGLGTVKEMRKYLVHAGSRIPMLKSSSQWPKHSTDWAFSVPSRHRFNTWESISWPHLLRGVSHFITVVTELQHRTAFAAIVSVGTVTGLCQTRDCGLMGTENSLCRHVEVLVRTVFDGFAVFVNAGFVYNGWNTLQLMVIWSRWKFQSSFCTNLNSAEISGSEIPHWDGIEIQKEWEAGVCHEDEIKPFRRRLCDTNNSQEEDEMRALKVFVHSRCEGDREEVRELWYYGRDLTVVEREVSCTACSLGQWIAWVREFVPVDQISTHSVNIRVFQRQVDVTRDSSRH
jgi:hypothetical protein